MNRQLRKRFLGAGVVVALAALILPFLMQGEGYKANQRLAEDAKTRIPERPAAPVRLDTQVPPAPADVRDALVEPEDLPEPLAPPASAPATAPAVAKSTPAPVAAVKPAPAEPIKPKPVPSSTDVKVKPLDRPLDKPVEKPAEKLASKPLEPSKPAAPPVTPLVSAPLTSTPPAPATKPVESNAKPASKPAESVGAEPASTAAKEAWVIQLGSFTAEANAQKLLEQAQRGGVSAKVEKIEVKGSPVWRVSSQTYASRAEADAALKALQARQNLSGMVRAVR